MARPEGLLNLTLLRLPFPILVERLPPLPIWHHSLPLFFPLYLVFKPLTLNIFLVSIYFMYVTYYRF